MHGKLLSPKPVSESIRAQSEDVVRCQSLGILLLRNSPS